MNPRKTDSDGLLQVGRWQKRPTKRQKQDGTERNGDFRVLLQRFDDEMLDNSEITGSILTVDNLTQKPVLRRMMTH